MTFLEILDTLILEPLRLVFEWIFLCAYIEVRHPGWAIVVLSIVMNILVLPLYRRADMMQEQAQEIEGKLKDGVKHIKKTFTGDERMMILQAYYRQNHYKPTDALKGSVSLLLEIPFFMAAYQFLSSLDLFEDVSFGAIANLSEPDGLLVLGGISINLLPVLMTVINLISSSIYLKGAAIKAKVQLYAMALFFLVFLYHSPACLVFYWTLNNVFSLGKNIVLKIISKKIEPPKIVIFIIKIFQEKMQVQADKKQFFGSMFFITILIGALIPSVYIAASPQEYIDVAYFFNPLWYVVITLCKAIGFFLIWMKVFYWLAGPRGKVIMEIIAWIFCGNMLVNYMFFGTELGIISSNLQYEHGMSFSNKEMIWALFVTTILSVILYYLISDWKKVTGTLLLIGSIAFSIMTLVNVVDIHNSLKELVIEENKTEIPNFELSKEGKNVIVLMLDRAIGAYVPYIFNEKPELKEQFEGFTYYSNVISFGKSTNFGTPALFGGYEYTPVEMNKRDTETLASKQNEALKVMPVLFLEEGYEVTVCDPPYANYQWISDLSIYDDYPEIDTYITKGFFLDEVQKENTINSNKRNFFLFSLMKCMPVWTQSSIYDNGRYNKMICKDDLLYDYQVTDTSSIAKGISYEFMESYNVLLNLSNMTNICNDNTNNFLFMANETAHSPMILQEPEYIPMMNVDNTIYDTEYQDRFVVDGKEIKMSQTEQVKSYHVNMAAFIQLGKWFDYLRENDVYDNTRIILVADHGYWLANCEELIFDKGAGGVYDAEGNYPLLMVKDFDSYEFTTSTEFMTNADVPALAMEAIIDSPRNPFTNKEINSDEKYAHEQYIILSNEWDIKVNNGNTFLPAQWGSVKDNMWDANNWKFYDETVVLKEHKAP